MLNRVLLVFSGILFITLSCAPKVVKKEAPAKGPVGAAYHVAYAIKEKVNVRQEPNARAGVVAQLEDGDRVLVLKNRKGWYQIQLDSGKKGWVRSDLVGPRNLSRTRMAAAFNDSVMMAFPAELFIDKNKPYKVIYLKFKKQNPVKMDLLVKRIARAYQQKVYPGAITVHVIKDNSDKFIKTYTFKAQGIAHVPLPVLPMGILEKVSLQGKSLKLQIIVPPNATKKALLRLARKVSARYEYPFEKVEIVLKEMTTHKCRLYFMEDGYGEDFAFDRCRPKAGR